MSTSLRLLVVEDNAADAELLLRELRRAGFTPAWRRVDTEAQFRAELTGDYDLVLSDFHLPQFSGLRALELLKASGRDIPFILVSGMVGEDTAVEAIRRGAADYLLKDRLARLGEAVRRALAEAVERRERIRTERALRESQEQLEELAEHSSDVFWSTSPDFKTIHYVSPAYEALWGRSTASLRADAVSWLEAVVPEDRPRVLVALEELAQGMSCELEFRIRRPDGSERWVLDHGAPVRDTSGRIVRIIGSIRDITETRRAAAVVEEASHRAVHDRGRSWGGGLVVVGAFSGGVYLLASRFDWFAGLLEGLGSKGAGLLLSLTALSTGVAVLSFRRWRATHQDLVRRELGESALRRLHDELDLRVRTRTTALSRVNAALRTEIAERRHAEEALRASEELYRTLITASPDAIVVMDLAGNITYVSGQALKLFGFSEQDQVLGRSVFDSIAPADCPRATENTARLVRERWIGVRAYTLLRKDGTTFAAEISAGLITGADRQPAGIILLARDTTAREAAQAALRESEELLRQVVETIHEVFWMSDVATGRVIYLSPGFERIWGRTCQSALESPGIWRESIHPDDRERMARVADGMAAAGGYDECYRISRPDGSLRWLHDRAFPVRGEGGAVRRMVGVAEDITERKKLEEQFLRAQRLEAVGTLAGGIAHDLNNILAPMLIATPMLRDKMQDAFDLQMLGIIEQGATRGANIIRQMLTFSRGVAGERRPVQVRHLIKEMTSMIRETFPRGITVVEKFDDDLWLITADTTQMHQVLMNLCVNARDAMHENGTLTLRAHNVVVDENAPPQSPARPGSYVRVSVSDTGDGIPAGNLAQIFDPFFTTKELGKGTGLGLSTVLGIVRSHDGHVSVESTVGKGSSFHVYLPANRGEEQPLPVRTPEAVHGNGETVLVVDDEPAVRESLGRLLALYNYRVLVAADGEEAQTLFDANLGTVQLVVTDMMMPRMDGVALLRELRARKPGLLCVAISGLQDAERRAELAGIGMDVVVMAKPFQAAEVLAAVHLLLAGKSDAALHETT